MYQNTCMVLQTKASKTLLFFIKTENKLDPDEKDTFNTLNRDTVATITMRCTVKSYDYSGYTTGGTDVTLLFDAGETSVNLDCYGRWCQLETTHSNHEHLMPPPLALQSASLAC